MYQSPLSGVHSDRCTWDRCSRLPPRTGHIGVWPVVLAVRHRAGAHQGDAAGLPNPMAGENSVRPPTQGVLVP